MLRVNARFQQAFQQLGLTSCESVVRHFIGNEPQGAAVVVHQDTLKLSDHTELPVFYKQYEYKTPSLKFIGRESKALREFFSYEVFSQLGVQAAEGIACGEGRDAIGRLRRAFILTKAIPGAITLKEFVEQHCSDYNTKEVRRLRHRLMAQLANMTQTIHRADFFHHDLVWRNILVTWVPPAEPELWWIDCPRGQFDRWSPLRQRRRLKDLASLDKVASELATARERLLFIKLYLGKGHLDVEARKLVHDALEYRRKRWPEDWR